MPCGERWGRPRLIEGGARWLRLAHELSRGACWCHSLCQQLAADCRALRLSPLVAQVGRGLGRDWFQHQQHAACQQRRAELAQLHSGAQSMSSCARLARGCWPRPAVRGGASQCRCLSCLPPAAFVSCRSWPTSRWGSSAQFSSPRCSASASAASADQVAQRFEQQASKRRAPSGKVYPSTTSNRWRSRSP